MKRLRDRRILPLAVLALLLWMTAAGLTVRWIVLRGQVPVLLTEVDSVGLPAALPGVDRLPFDRGSTCAPLTLQLVQIFQEVGIDTFSYVADLSEHAPIAPEITTFLRSLEPSGETGAEPEGTIHRLRAVVDCRTRYEKVRDLLEIVAGADPPLGLRRLEMRASGADLEVEVELIGLSLEI